MEPRLSLVTLGVADLARSRKFYVEGLGLPMRPESQDSVVFIGLNGMWLSLFSREALAEDAHVSAEGTGEYGKFGGITLAHNVRSKTEVDALLIQAEKAGGKIVKPAQDAVWGGYSGYFSDPDGHLWEVAWNPHFWIE
jgi:catechol 2,3-dioxygenase-like lactoylglutathione lyase family enzyme